MSLRRLNEQFPDLSVSVIQAVQTQYKTDAFKLLKQLSNSEPTEQEKHRMLAELADYKALGSDTILRVLKDNGWDVDQSIVPLFNLLCEMNTAPNKQKAHNILAELFCMLSNEEIQKVLDKHDGDVDGAGEELLQRVTQLSPASSVEAPEEKRRREREEMIATLSLRFPNVSRDECTKALTRVGWSLQEAVHVVLKKLRDAKIDAYRASLTASEISAAIEGNDINGAKTKENLDHLVNQKAAGKAVQAPTTVSPQQVDEKMKEEAKKIGDQLNELIAAKQPETMALQALCATIRLGNKPGFDNQEAQSQQQAGDSPVEGAKGPTVVGLNLAVLWVVDTSFNKSDKIVVTWSHSAPTSGDWIGMYLEHESERNYITYQWVDLATKEVTFIAPTTCGKYNFRYFHDRSYLCHGTSTGVNVGPQFALTTTNVSSNEIKLKIQQNRGEACHNLWIALYPHGQTNPKSYLTYKWAKDGEELAFNVPKAGSWNFKVFPDRGYDYATTYSVTVKGTDSLTLKLDKERNKAIVEYDVTTVDPATDNVWIGIYHENQADSRYYRRYKYISTKKGKFEVKAMQTAGTYEARLFACGTYDVLSTSESRVTVN